MSSSVTVDVLAEVAGRVLEDTAFVFTDRAPDPASWSEAAVAAEIGYAGPEQGEIRMVASPALAARLAANMLGAEPEDAESVERGPEAVREVLNVVAGALMARVFGTGVVCHLDVPRAPRERPEGAPPACCTLDLVTMDDDRLELRVFEMVS
jgi:CheY-specific phosphatase CheX